MSLLAKIFYEHYVICWIIDFTYWCFLGFTWLVMTLVPLMLVKHFMDTQ